MIAENKIFLSAHLDDINQKLDAAIETYICLFVYCYCDFEIEVCFVDDADDYPCSISLLGLGKIKYSCLEEKHDELQDLCLVLPAIKADDGKIRVAGVCAVLRWTIKDHISRFSCHYSKALLGFRGGCLVACTESSVWTRFCELQLPASVSEIAVLKRCGADIEKLPESLVLLEAHFNRPVRTHNILKRKLDVAKKAKQESSYPVPCDKLSNSVVSSDSSIKFTIYDSNSLPVKTDDISKALENLVITEQTQEFSLDHNYLEGIDLTLADMVVFPSVHYLLSNLPPQSSLHLENVIKWYERMSTIKQVKLAAERCSFGLKGICPNFNISHTDNIIVPDVDKDSLYRRDSSHTKLKIKHRSPIDVLNLLQDSSIHPHYSSNYCTTLDWTNLPTSLHPATGDLPQKRLDRKCQQIESIVTATLKIAVAGQTIVEFCAGGGHVGLLLAYFLPKCKIILIENKESSISRAKSRAEALKLTNIVFYQCNLDYFKGSFDMGVALHACGVATDLVIQQCIKQQASFVCCPCCYGSIQNTHLLSYPMSKKFCSSLITYKMYMLLAHCADRTEVNTPTAKQGELCMGLIDTDRKLHATECKYEVDLTILQPLSCSPKHNLLIGRSPKWKGSVFV